MLVHCPIHSSNSIVNLQYVESITLDEYYSTFSIIFSTNSNVIEWQYKTKEERDSVYSKLLLKSQSL